MQNNTFFGHYQPYSLIVLDNVSSTNDYSKLLLSNFKPQLPFTAIMAKKQTNGKGQRGAHWLSQPNENLTVSYLHTPTDLPITNQFILTIISSLAVYSAIAPYINAPLRIKWPNDIMVKNKKIAGILIENKISATYIKHSIIGIGLNVMTTKFPTEIEHKTTSLILEKFDFNLTIIDLARKIQHQLFHYNALYEREGYETLHKLYTEKLFRRNEKAKYTINNQSITGEILDVDLDGRLIIKIEDQENKYDLKGISYQL